MSKTSLTVITDDAAALELSFMLKLAQMMLITL